MEKDSVLCKQAKKIIKKQSQFIPRLTGVLVFFINFGTGTMGFSVNAALGKEYISNKPISPIDLPEMYGTNGMGDEDETQKYVQVLVADSELTQ